MALNEKNRLRFVAGMSKRIAELRAKTEESLDFAIDTMFHDRVDSYFRVEQGLAEVDRMLNLIESDLEIKNEDDSQKESDLLTTE